VVPEAFAFFRAIEAQPGGNRISAGQRRRLQSYYLAEKWQPNGPVD